MSELTPLAITALALLREHSMHPYEMFQLMVQRHDDRLVKVRPGSLYHTVDRLARQGLVRATGTERAGNRPERTTYEITDSGRAALADRLAGLLGQRVEEYPLFPLALAEAHNIEADEVARLLENRQLQSRERLEQLRGGVRKLGAREVPEAYWIDVAFAIRMAEAELDWLDGLIDRLRSGDVAWDHHDVDWNPFDPDFTRLIKDTP
ncbi:PadR family transcriptional regulator [Schumannella sp. 10F1B-5-1]|uniref:PadR family transcriptional regulator n=1 Tax=Schumannella sp. 10F1B-5-1 TaxID=2590780 RepID=UPI00112FE5CA|nr:PadR family transcriptional regulator [Schumannella sp. 10F1B-5-1]TPW76905.1 PadR family transcriptional regulator [Schumannella sp. 10F1B-5-1]